MTRESTAYRSMLRLTCFALALMTEKSMCITCIRVTFFFILDEFIRKFSNPNCFSVSFCHISTCPLYTIVFYSKENSMIFSYSINGQFLEGINEKTGFVYNMSVLKSSDST
jgi:hypothetical protein